jgi:hypothetical protein
MGNDSAKDADQTLRKSRAVVFIVIVAIIAAAIVRSSIAGKTDSIYDLLAEHVRSVQTEPLENIPPLRNPGIE